MDGVTIELLRELIARQLADAIAPVAADVEALRNVVTLQLAEHSARLEQLETPAQTEEAEAVEAVLEGEEIPESEEQLEDAIEVAVEAAEIDSEIEEQSAAIEPIIEEEIEADIAPAVSHPLLRRFGGS